MGIPPQNPRDQKEHANGRNINRRIKEKGRQKYKCCFKIKFSADKSPNNAKSSRGISIPARRRKIPCPGMKGNLRQYAWTGTVKVSIKNKPEKTGNKSFRERVFHISDAATAISRPAKGAKQNVLHHRMCDCIRRKTEQQEHSTIPVPSAWNSHASSTMPPFPKQTPEDSL